MLLLWQGQHRLAAAQAAKNAHKACGRLPLPGLCQAVQPGSYPRRLRGQPGTAGMGAIMPAQWSNASAASADLASMAAHNGHHSSDACTNSSQGCCYCNFAGIAMRSKLTSSIALAAAAAALQAIILTAAPTNTAIAASMPPSPGYDPLNDMQYLQQLHAMYSSKLAGVGQVSGCTTPLSLGSSFQLCDAPVSSQISAAPDVMAVPHAKCSHVQSHL